MLRRARTRLPLCSRICSVVEGWEASTSGTSSLSASAAAWTTAFSATVEDLPTLDRGGPERYKTLSSTCPRVSNKMRGRELPAWGEVTDHLSSAPATETLFIPGSNAVKLLSLNRFIALLLRAAKHPFDDCFRRKAQSPNPSVYVQRQTPVLRTARFHQRSPRPGIASRVTLDPTGVLDRWKMPVYYHRFG